MKKCLVCSVTMAIAALSYAGAAGLAIKGVSRSWDEIARIALKVSGRELTDDAVKSAAKTIERAVGKYGDDVAKASARGGVEFAEQTMKRGGRFFAVLQKAIHHSDKSLRALAVNADDIAKYSVKYGDDVIVNLNAKVPGQVSRMVAATEKSGIEGVKQVLHKVSGLPDGDITRVLGAVEKNPWAAREFLEGVEKGGERFVDKVFEINAKQIMAGGLSASMIIAAIRVTAPFDAIGTQIENGPPIDGNGMIDGIGDGLKYSMTILALCIGAGLIVYVVRKTNLAKQRNAGQCVPEEVVANVAGQGSSLERPGMNNEFAARNKE